LRGLVKARRGRKRSALLDLDKAVPLDPNYGAAYARRATVNHELGHDALAADDMAAAAGLAQVNLGASVEQNNIWQTRHLQVEETMAPELNR